jgi:hypothetical protein
MGLQQPISVHDMSSSSKIDDEKTEREREREPVKEKERKSERVKEPVKEQPSLKDQGSQRSSRRVPMEDVQEDSLDEDSLIPLLAG